MSESELHQLLVEWNDTTIIYPQDKCIHELFKEQVEKTPDAVAVVFEQEQVTYEQLNQRANQLAHHLQSLGVKPEVLVGICVERSIEMVVGLLGILKAGGAYVPLDPNYPQERLSYMLEDSGVGVLVTQSHLLESLPEHNARLVCLDSDWGRIEQQSQENFDARVSSDNLAYVICTSGSTGKPKGVMITHQALSSLTQTAISEYKITASDRVLQFASINFDVAVEEIYPCLSTGATLILRSNEMVADFEKFVQICVEKHLTLLNLPTAYWHQLVTDLASTEVSLPESLRLVIIGSEKVLSEPVRYWQEYVTKSSLSNSLQLINAYGPTETTVTATVYPIQSSIYSFKNEVPIGRPISNTQIYILDSHLQPVPVGVPGELYIGGDGLARGYLNRPQLTQEKFITNPFSNSKSQRLYRTGDLARYLQNGNIEFLGRIDNQVKIRGFRIKLGEIETVLSSHPQVNQAVVIAQEDNNGNKRLAAYIVAESEITTPQLRHYIKAQLPEYMVPSAFVSLESLPLTPNGKVDRKVLQTADGDIVERDTEYIAPRTQSEQIIANIFAQVLNVENIGIGDNFFDLGGHSLLAVRLISQIQKQFDQNLPLATLFQSPTVEELAYALGSNLSPQLWSPLVPIQPNGSLPPLFCVAGTGGNVLYFHQLARYLGKNQPFYGLQPQGLDGETLPLESIEEIATQYRRAIQTVQPTGPYFLAGHSFGGHVAFEMATQLQSMGESVAYVGILDMPAPIKSVNPIDDFSKWDDARWICQMAEVIEELGFKNLVLSHESLASLTREQQLNYFKEKLEMVGFLPPQTDIKVVSGLVQVSRTQGQIKYEPQNTDSAPITLFRAVDSELQTSSHISQEPTWGWNQFSEEEVEVYIVPGNHHSMMSEPHVKKLAEKMQQSLEQVQKTKL